MKLYGLAVPGLGLLFFFTPYGIGLIILIFIALFIGSVIEYLQGNCSYNPKIQTSEKNKIKEMTERNDKIRVQKIKNEYAGHWREYAIDMSDGWSKKYIVNCIITRNTSESVTEYNKRQDAYAFKKIKNKIKGEFANYDLSTIYYSGKEWREGLPIEVVMGFPDRIIK